MTKEEEALKRAEEEAKAHANKDSSILKKIQRKIKSEYLGAAAAAVRNEAKLKEAAAKLASMSGRDRKDALRSMSSKERAACKVHHDHILAIPNQNTNPDPNNPNPNPNPNIRMIWTRYQI